MNISEILLSWFANMFTKMSAKKEDVGDRPKMLYRPIEVNHANMLRYPCLLEIHEDASTLGRGSSQMELPGILHLRGSFKHEQGS